MRILIVDDSRAMRMIVKKTLRQAGFGHCAMSEASDGSEALSLINSNPPEVVLSDWFMPNMTGMDLLKAVNTGTFSGCFGFVTSAATPEMRQTAEELGASFVLDKPLSSTALRTTLERLGVEPSTHEEQSTSGTAAVSLKPDGVARALNSLLQRRVSAQKSREVNIRARGQNITALYSDSTGSIAAACVCEHDVAISMGAALSLLPRRGYAEALKTRTLSPALQENIREVFNVFARLLSRERRQNFTLHEVQFFPDIPERTVRQLARRGEVFSAELTVASYGSGRLSFFCHKREQA